MRPAFRYYGGKSRIAPWIGSLLPEHRSYLEPFFGAGAVLFAKSPSRREIINDLDTAVVNFYRVLRTDLDALVHSLRLTHYGRDEFKWCRYRYSDDTDPIEQARRFFVTVSQSFSSATGTAEGWARRTKPTGGTNGATEMQARVDALHLIADRLRHVMIENRPAIEVIDGFGKPDTVIYADPPYVHAARGDVKSGTGYRFEMTDDDHRELAAALHATPATVFLSGYRCDLYQELYGDWPSVERDTHSTLATSPSTKGIERTEIVWSNRPINDGRLF